MADTKVEDISLSLLTTLFNSNQTVDRFEAELEVAKDNLKMAKGERDMIIAEINHQVPRLHAAAQQQNLMHEGLQSLPPLDQWRLGECVCPPEYVKSHNGEHFPECSQFKKRNNDHENDGA